MLVELRDRIMRVSNLPRLPGDWYAEVALRSAGGTPFAGDFVVAARPGDGDRLEIAVVDVSGKGAQAGVRALQLSGAFGGLLGAVPPDELPQRRQRLPDPPGLGRGLRHRHPPVGGPAHRRRRGALRRPPARRPAHRRHRPLVGGARRGPGPGPDPRHRRTPPVTGLLRRGDAIMLYTDGLVETPTRDMGSASTGCSARPSGCCARASTARRIERLIETLGSRHDDRALLVLHRR